MLKTCVGLWRKSYEYLKKKNNLKMGLTFSPFLKESVETFLNVYLCV